LLSETFANQASNEVCVNGDPPSGKPLVGFGRLIPVKVEKLSQDLVVLEKDDRFTVRLIAIELGNSIQLLER
jgi:hypothetical protein